MESVIFTLFNLATQIKWLSETSEIAIKNKNFINQITYSGFYEKVPFAKAISGISQNHLIIYCCSFLDEFEKELTPSKYPDYSNKIIELKRITKPAMTRIKKWKDIKEHRNNIVAHNLRIKGNSIFDYIQPIKYKIPTTNGEFKLLADLIFLIAQNIAPIFPEIVQKLDFRKTINDYLSLDSEKIDCEKEFEIAENEIIKNKKST